MRNKNPNSIMSRVRPWRSSKRSTVLLTLMLPEPVDSHQTDSRYQCPPPHWSLVTTAAVAYVLSYVFICICACLAIARCPRWKLLNLSTIVSFSDRRQEYRTPNSRQKLKMYDDIMKEALELTRRNEEQKKQQLFCSFDYMYVCLFVTFL